ncbi:CRISPR-associated protein [Escherichia coli]|uniref:CRISPR-associated protein n=1 Tax=Escherichia coli TaxID=562 RepID=A0A376L9V9_ECOLX|nr:CRISPR-associated protein [Escherichia coli]
MTFVPLSPIPLKDRTSMIFLQYGQIDVLDGAFVLIDKNRDTHAHSGGSGRLYYARTGNESFPRSGASGRHGGDATGLGR